MMMNIEIEWQPITESRSCNNDARAVSISPAPASMWLDSCVV